MHKNTFLSTDMKGFLTDDNFRGRYCFRLLTCKIFYISLSCLFIFLIANVEPCRQSVVRASPLNTKPLNNIYTTSAQRVRRWADVVEMLYKCFVFAARDTFDIVTASGQ